MAIDGVKNCVPGLTAGADLSSSGFVFVKMSADFTVVACAAITDCPVGIVNNAPKNGAEASVTFKGVEKIQLGGTVTAGQRVGTDANGHAVALTEGTSTTAYVVGQMLEGGVAGDIRSILLAGTPHRAS